MLEAKNIKKIYKTGTHETVVLKGLSFVVNEGDFVSVIGRSGSGKSTLLYQLSLLDRPSEGTVLFSGEDMNILSSAQRTQVRLHKMGYIFQDYALIPTLTARENILVPLIMQERATPEAEKLANEALERVDLADKGDNLPSQLSGGQQQRVSIARAIAHCPTIIFADEPTANLDSESSEMIIDLFQKLNREGQTIVMVTHELEYAKKTKRIIRLSDGAIV